MFKYYIYCWFKSIRNDKTFNLKLSYEQTICNTRRVLEQVQASRKSQVIVMEEVLFHYYRILR